MSAKIETILRSIDSELKNSGAAVAEKARSIASNLIDEAKVIVNEEGDKVTSGTHGAHGGEAGVLGGAADQKAEKLMRHAEEHKKMSEAGANEAETALRAIAKHTDSKDAKRHIETVVLPKVAEERAKWKTADSTSFLNAYDSLRKFYSSLKKEKATVEDLQLGLTHLVYYLLNTTQGIVPGAAGAAVVGTTPQSVYESSVIRAIKDDIYKGRGYLKTLNRNQLLDELKKSYEAITSNETDTMSRSEQIIVIDSIVKAINDLSSDQSSRYGGAHGGASGGPYSLIPETSEFTFDLVKVRLGILSIYSKLNTLYPIAKKINAGTTMTEQQEARFVRAVSRIEEYVTYANIKRDMLFRISPVESILYNRVMTEISGLRDITDPDVVKFLMILEQAMTPLLANNAVSSNHINDFVIDIGVDAIELDNRIFKLIREIGYKRRLVGFVDISQNTAEIKANLASQAKQFTESEKIAIARSVPAAGGAAAWSDETTKAITQISGTSIQLDYMTQLMNYEATTEPANADTVYNAIFRSKNRVHDNLSYAANPVVEIQNATVGGKISTDAVRTILPEIENMINIFARITKTKEFTGPKEIADAMYRFIALEDTVDFTAPAATIYKKTSGETLDVKLGNILRLFSHYNSHAVSIGNIINPGAIYSRFADFNDQHGFGGSIEDEQEKYGAAVSATAGLQAAAFKVLSKEALDFIHTNYGDVTTVDANFNVASGNAAQTEGVNVPALDHHDVLFSQDQTGHFLITLPVALAAAVSGNILLAPYISRLLFGPNTFVEGFCSAVVAYTTDDSLTFVPRGEGAPGVYDFRAAEITFRKRQGQGIDDIVGIAIAKDPRDSVHRDDVRRNTEDLLNGFIADKQLAFVNEEDFHNKKNLIFLLLQHFEVSTDINARRRGERANLAKMIEVVEQSRVCNGVVSLVSDEEIVTLYYNLALEASRVTEENGVLQYADEGVRFAFSIPTLDDCPHIMAIALEKLTAKYGHGSEALTQFDVHILGSRREADFVSQNALQLLGDIDAMVVHDIPDVSLARALVSFAKTFAIDIDTMAGKDVVNNTLHLLHTGDRAGHFHAVQARHGALPGNVGAPAQVAAGQPLAVVPYANAPFVKDIFVLWNQYNLLNNIYMTLGSSTPTSMDLLVSDMDIEIRKANIPVIHGDEKATIANNIFARYISMLKLIVGRIFSVVDKNLIESNVGKSSTLERYKLGVADLFGGADFSYNRENKDKYIKFVLLAEWYFTFFKSKDMFDIKPFIMKESGPFRGLNEAVFAKVYDNVAYSSVSLGKIVGSVNVDSNIQHYIEAINRAIGFYIFNSVDRPQGANAVTLASRFDEAVTSANIFSGIPNKLPLTSTFDLDVANGARQNVVKSRYDLSVSTSAGNIAEMYSRNDRLVKLLADVNSGFETVDLSQHDEFALANITETFNKKVQGKSIDQESLAFLDFINTIDSFEFSNKQNIVSNFINIPIKLADDLALLFEDDYNELTTRSNYGKLKNLIVGNDSLFKIDTTGKKLRFTTHIPTMITTLIDIASSSLIKYSSYVDYSKLGDIEKQISFVKRKRDMISSRLNSNELSTQMIETMLPHVIMELYKDHMKVYTPGEDADGNPIPDPAWVGKQADVLAAAEGHRGRGIPRTTFEHGRVALAVGKALADLRETAALVASSTAFRAAPNAAAAAPKDEVVAFETAVARTLAVGNYLVHLSAALEDGVPSVDEVVERYVRVAKTLVAFTTAVRNNMIYTAQCYNKIGSKVRSRNRAELIVEIAGLRADATRATGTDYIFFDFYTNEQMADKLLAATEVPSLTKKRELGTHLAAIKHDLDIVDNALQGFAAAAQAVSGDAANLDRVANAAIAAQQPIDTVNLETDVNRALSTLKTATDTQKAKARAKKSADNRNTQAELTVANAALDAAQLAYNNAVTALDAAKATNSTRAPLLVAANKAKAGIGPRVANSALSIVEFGTLAATLGAKPAAAGDHDAWMAWNRAVDNVAIQPAVRAEGFRVDQNPAAPIDSGSNHLLRRALNGAHGPHRQFYQIYHMMFLIYSSTSDTKLKNLMRSLLHHIDVQETFSSFSKSILSQLDFGGSYDDFARTKDYRTVAALGDFSSAIDFKATEFNKTRLASYLGMAVFRDMMGLMSVNQTGFSSSKEAEDNVKDIIHKASAIALMVRGALGVLGVPQGLFDLNRVNLIQPVEVGSRDKYKDYSLVNVDLLCSGSFGTAALNSRDICSSINYVETHCGDKAKADVLRVKHPAKPCHTACLVPAATIAWNGTSQIDLNAWLRSGLPTALYTYSKDMLASISDRMDKMIVYLHATIANLYRVFGKGHKLVSPPTVVPAEYANVISAAAAAVEGTQQVEGAILQVVNTQDAILSRAAEALFTKARILDIPVFVPFKKAYTNAEIVMIAKSDFAVTAPDAVSCRHTKAALSKITGESQIRAISEILLTPGETTASAITLPGITGVDHADYVAKGISPAAVAAINELAAGKDSYQFVAFNETNSVETLAATGLTRKLRLVLDCRFPCSVKEYVSMLNDIGELLVTTKASNKNIWNYLMSRLKAQVCGNNGSPAKDLVNRYVVVLGNAIANLEIRGGGDQGHGLSASTGHHHHGPFGGSAAPAVIGAPGSYGEIRHQFGGAPDYGYYRHQFGGAPGAPTSYGDLRNQFGGAPDYYSAYKHQFRENFGGLYGAPGAYGEIRHQFGGAPHGRPSTVFASQLPPNSQEDQPASAHEFLAEIHRNFISGAKVTDLGKNTKDLELYVTRQDAANNLPTLHNALTNLNRVVTAIAQLAKEWLGRSNQKTTAYARNVGDYLAVCLSIKAFTGEAMNAIAKELNTDPSIGEALKSLVKNINHNEMAIKNIYDVVLSDVHVILPRVAIKGSPFAFMSPVFNALFYAGITGNTDVLPPIRELDNSAPFLLSCISNIANVRLAKNLSFGKRYEKLPYSNTLSADDRSISRNILYLNNIVDININPIKLSYMKQAPLFYATEVFSRVFDRSVREYVNNAYGEFSEAEKTQTYRVADPANAGAHIDKSLSANYNELIEFLVDPLEFYKVHRNGNNAIVLPEEFKNGVTRGRGFNGQGQVYGHSIDIAGANGHVGTNILYFWTKEVYKFMRNFLVDRISHAGDAGEVGINRGLNALIRDGHIFK